MELGWGSGVKRILFGVFSEYYDEMQEILNCKRYGDLFPLYAHHEWPKTQFCINFDLDRIIANICEEADEIHFLLDDLRFETTSRFDPVLNSIQYEFPATLSELHIVLTDYIEKTTFYKGPYKIDSRRVYEWWTCVQ